MNVWAVSFSEKTFTEELYETGLVLVDEESQTRIKRFYHKNDSYRCLLGRLLPRLLLKQHGISPKEAVFGRTSSGKPYVGNTPLERTVGFNVSHDNEFIVMTFQTCEMTRSSHGQGHEDAPQTHSIDMDVTTIGVDVMKVALPRYEKSLRSFVQSISDTPRVSHANLRCQLTVLEQRTLQEDRDDDDALRRLFLVWTLKEAYTKALGLGLGFDFKRIEVDVNGCRVSVDGTPPVGWEFTVFTLISQSGSAYQVAVARYTGFAGNETSGTVVHVDVRGRVDGKTDMADWFAHYDADSFIRRVAEEK